MSEVADRLTTDNRQTTVKMRNTIYCIHTGATILNSQFLFQSVLFAKGFDK
jgi:hypothetical protein